MKKNSELINRQILFEDEKYFYFGLVIWFTIGLIRISFEEILVWDESLYSIRVLAALKDGLLGDQTLMAPGGLYSSSHPPLYVWLTLPFVWLAGEGAEWAYRIVPLLASTGIIVVSSKFTNRIFDKYLVFLGFIFCFQFNTYGVKAQLDSLYCFLNITSLYFWWKYYNNSSSKNLVLSSIFFSLAMLSKIIVGLFIPIIITVFIGLRWLATREKYLIRLYVKTLLAFLLGLIPFGIWAFYMYQNHGETFVNRYFFFHIVSRMSSVLEDNRSPLGAMFYVNQLLTGISIFTIIATFAYKGVRNNKYQFLIVMAIVPLLIFTASSTKLSSYTLPIIIPTVILAASSFDRFNKALSSYLVLIPYFVVLLWSVSQDFRDFAQANLEYLLLPILIGTVLALVTRNRRRVIFSLSIILLSAKVGLTNDFFVGMDTHYAEIAKTYSIQQISIFSDDENTGVNEASVDFYFYDLMKKNRIKAYTVYSKNRINSNEGNLYVVSTYRKVKGYQHLIDTLEKNCELINVSTRYKVYLKQ